MTTNPARRRLASRGTLTGWVVVDPVATSHCLRVSGSAQCGGGVGPRRPSMINDVRVRNRATPPPPRAVCNVWNRRRRFLAVPLARVGWLAGRRLMDDRRIGLNNAHYHSVGRATTDEKVRPRVPSERRGRCRRDKSCSTSDGPWWVLFDPGR